VVDDLSDLRGLNQVRAEWKPICIMHNLSKLFRCTRDLGTVTYLDKHGNIRVALDGSDRTVGWNLNQNKHLDYAYAMTSHSSQGTTVDRVLIHVDTSDSRTRALVHQTLGSAAASRPRYDAQVFTDNAGNLGAALNRSHQNAMALAPEQIRSYAMGI
jgi:ATP-dependent exoDNAse (exonuclease V) alpha subunit